MIEEQADSDRYQERQAIIDEDINAVIGGMEEHDNEEVVEYNGNSCPGQSYPDIIGKREFSFAEPPPRDGNRNRGKYRGDDPPHEGGIGRKKEQY